MYDGLVLQVRRPGSAGLSEVVEKACTAMCSFNLRVTRLWLCVFLPGKIGRNGGSKLVEERMTGQRVP